MSRCARVALLGAIAACSSRSTPASDAAVPVGDTPMQSWTTLFDGTLTSAWKMSTIANQPGQDDPGSFEVIDGALVARPGNDIGLLWHTTPAPPDFELALAWRATSLDDNSGVFVRFPDLDSKGYNNTAYVAVHFGFEIQIDERGFPDGAAHHTTGAIYNETAQTFTRVPARPVGEWNDFVIRVRGQTYEVFLNGAQTARFGNPHADRGTASPAFIGLQTHPPPGAIAYRDIRIRSL